MAGWFCSASCCGAFHDLDRHQELFRLRLVSIHVHIFQGMPADKESYWKRCLGFGDPVADLVASWKAYKADPSFHHLKDILVEWTDAHSQRAAKVMALGAVCLRSRHR